MTKNIEQNGNIQNEESSNLSESEKNTYEQDLLIALIKEEEINKSTRDSIYNIEKEFNLLKSKFDKELIVLQESDERLTGIKKELYTIQSEYLSNLVSVDKFKNLLGQAAPVVEKFKNETVEVAKDVASTVGTFFKDTKNKIKSEIEKNKESEKPTNKFFSNLKEGLSMLTEAVKTDLSSPKTNSTPEFEAPYKVEPPVLTQHESQNESNNMVISVSNTDSEVKVTENVFPSIEKTSSVTESVQTSYDKKSVFEEWLKQAKINKKLTNSEIFENYLSYVKNKYPQHVEDIYSYSNGVFTRAYKKLTNS